MEKTAKIRKTRKAKERLMGNRIKEYMVAKGIIAEELADITGLCPSFISRILNNHRACISLPIALLIGSALDTPVEKLFIYKRVKFTRQP